jgi:hypothetical protein
VAGTKGRRQKRKVFFFEKKKQKTFTYGTRLAGSARVRQLRTGALNARIRR